MIKKIIFIVLFIFSSLLSERIFAQAPLSVAPNGTNVVPGVLYIQFKAKHGIDFEHLSDRHTGNAELDNFFVSIGVDKISPFDPDAKNYAVARRHGIDRMYVINFQSEGHEPRDVTGDILMIDAIEKACPRLIARKCYTPNDPDATQQYALDNMHIKDAWGISEGSANILIADVDEGVNYNHEDLKGNIYLIDGKYPGRDMVGKGNANNLLPTNDPMPPPGFNHGTMTTGCFGAVADNGIGGAGSGFKCKIMAVKISDSLGTLVAGWEGIQYAVEHGAKIINCSWGTPLNLKNPGEKNYYDFNKTIIDEILDTGALVVAAAGNDGVNIDDSAFVPASMYGVLSVGATTSSNIPASFTNFGHLVSVYASGESIFSTSFPGNNAYATESGTSFSCPLTAGVAGLLWAKHTDWLPQFVAHQIIQTCDNLVNPANRTNYWGLVNAYTALSQSPTFPEVGITDFSVDGADKGGLQYLDKVYSLTVSYKNYLAAGSGIQVRLLPLDGSSGTVPNGGYTVQQGTATLGTMSSLQQLAETFQFTRDGTDQGQGSQLSLYFAISYGNATVENQKYYDTLRLDINITGDDSYTAAVAQGNSNILQLGNSYPNPAIDDASIDFELSRSGYVKLELCDVLGRSIDILAEGVYGTGKRSVHCDTRTLPNGIYFYKLETSDGAVMTKRLIVAH